MPARRRWTQAGGFRRGRLVANAQPCAIGLSAVGHTYRVQGVFVQRRREAPFEQARNDLVDQRGPRGKDGLDLGQQATGCSLVTEPSRRDVVTAVLQRG